ncbi:hypothetical protein TL16_g09393 [Triparma laevis f. inornata]|uniref:Cysteine synthase n=1 Tax=Triparma laevis f. inornata TaxID=1714386 RepID=A0A9W7B9N3_9STRA|nr:hypothetical protein TL16_g09393 [Triparma laevis f. inornata]
MKHESILTTVGATPLVKLNRLSPNPSVSIYTKIEAFNPMGSVKDRLALGVIEWAEAHGKLSPGQTVIEASSGNTGIGLAMVCAAKGYPYVCVMAESFSIERRKLMRFLGAKVILTNPAHKGSGMVIKCNELAEKHGWFNTDQFSNEANAWVHAQTTGPEIISAMGKTPLTDFFCAWGTGGTLKGTASHLRKTSPDTKIHCCEPDNAPLLFSGTKTSYEADGRFSEPHPVWRPHLLQGWAPDFIPKLLSEAIDAGYVDSVCHVGGDAAHDIARALAQKEGIFTGTSGGGVVSCAIEFAKTAPAGTNIVCILADTGERYLSTPLFADIPADMTAEERSPPQPPQTPPPASPCPPVTEDNVAFVNNMNKKHKVVVWSLEYCEFCWTIFGLFKALNVPYEVVNVDSFQYAKDNQGNKYRSALSSITDCKTFPQCFIDGVFFGGAADACMKWKSKELQPLLEAAGIEYNKDYDGDSFEFLPKWMSQNPLRSK